MADFGTQLPVGSCCGNTGVVLQQNIVRFDQEPWNGLNLIVEHDHVRGVTRSTGVTRLSSNAGGISAVVEAARRGGLADVLIRLSEPTQPCFEVLVPTVIKHEPIMGESGVRPIEVTEQGLVTEDEILSARLQAQSLDITEVPDQHVGSTNAKITLSCSIYVAIIVQRWSTTCAGSIWVSRRPPVMGVN